MLERGRIRRETVCHGPGGPVFFAWELAALSGGCGSGKGPEGDQALADCVGKHCTIVFCRDALGATPRETPIEPQAWIVAGSKLGLAGKVLRVSPGWVVIAPAEENTAAEIAVSREVI
jgi:hypothetical protein